jgi:hypothetical protein
VRQIVLLYDNDEYAEICEALEKIKTAKSLETNTDAASYAARKCKNLSAHLASADEMTALSSSEGMPEEERKASTSETLPLRMFRTDTVRVSTEMELGSPVLAA